MKHKRLFAVFALLVVVAMAIVPVVSAAPNVVESAKVSKAPVLDGKVDDVWAQAKAIEIPVTGGVNNPSTTVVLKSVYTDDMVYFLAQWADPTQSFQRAPWQKQQDGTWKQLKDGPSGDNNKYYEDKYAMIWNINDSIAGFNQSGCMVTCHAGEPGKPYGNKYTAKEGEIGDMWHWKSVRTGPNGQIDDQYVDSTRYDKDKAPEAGRKSDAKTAGGYNDNISDDKKGPKFAAAGNKPTPPYWIVDKDKVAFDDSKYKAGDEVAGIIVSPFTGDRGDISSGSAYADGKWTVEYGRKLNTGGKTDVQYTDLKKTYYFGVATFDNAQVRHAFATTAYGLTFAPAASAAVQPVAAQLPRTGGLPIALAGLGGVLLIGIGWATRRFLVSR